MHSKRVGRGRVSLSPRAPRLAANGRGGAASIPPLVGVEAEDPTTIVGGKLTEADIKHILASWLPSVMASWPPPFSLRRHPLRPSEHNVVRKEKRGICKDKGKACAH